MPSPASYRGNVAYLNRDCRDAWLLAAGALDAGLIEAANRHAGQAWRLSSRDHYQVVMAQGTEVLKSALVTPGWAYQTKSGWLPVLLVHPSAGPFLAATFGHDFDRVLAHLREQGEGWARLDAALEELLGSYFEMPDDLSDLDGPTASSWP